MNEVRSHVLLLTFSSPYVRGAQPRRCHDRWHPESLLWLLSVPGSQLAEFRAFPSLSSIHLCLLFFCLQDWQWATLFTYFLKDSAVCLSVSYRCQCLICLGGQENKWTYYAIFRSPSRPPPMCLSPFCSPRGLTALCPHLHSLWCSEGIF